MGEKEAFPWVICPRLEEGGKPQLRKKGPSGPGEHLKNSYSNLWEKESHLNS